ncbi:MAG: cyclic nucleotide-binding domain-containing protein [Bdellovibrio sp.]|nr:cyclic nucleotide-binding domain-containing protein [Bdellovibrio sp.]
MSMADLVRGCSLFHELYDNEVEDIIRRCFVASYVPGQSIIKQGDMGTEICIILSGEAEVVVDHLKERKTLAKLSKGDIFGELVLINETRRTAHVIASAPTDVLVITYEEFYSFYTKRPEIFSLLVLNVTRLVTKRLKKANDLIENLTTAKQIPSP